MKLIMKVVLVALMVFALFVTERFYRLGAQSQAGESPGLVAGLLSPCPPTPNCVNSEFPEDKNHYIEPLDLPDTRPADLMQRLAATLELMGGVVNEQTEEYLAATFRSSLFHFVDDFEVRVDAENHVIHLRSASRVGHGDLGVNGQRTSEFRERLGTAL